MTPRVFVTGTDTGVGKTVAAVALLRGLVAAGIPAIGMKPVAAGFDAGEQNADVVALAAAGSVEAPLADRNPYRFAAPVAPHLAAARENVRIDLEVIVAAYRRLAHRAEGIVVEGAGGALVPLAPGVDMLDIARALDLPVLLVVGMRLGCLNHARLSVVALRARGVRFGGWIASWVDLAMAEAEGNLAWLARELPAPLIAELHSPEPPPIPVARWVLAGAR